MTPVVNCGVAVKVRGRVGGMEVATVATVGVTVSVRVAVEVVVAVDVTVSVAVTVPVEVIVTVPSVTVADGLGVFVTVGLLVTVAVRLGVRDGIRVGSRVAVGAGRVAVGWTNGFGNGMPGIMKMTRNAAKTRSMIVLKTTPPIEVRNRKAKSVIKPIMLAKAK